MINELLLQFARWLDAQTWSTALHESYYMYSWVETTHVLTLMVFLGMLFTIHLRMLGWVLTDIPASKVAERLDKPMLAGFVVMFVSGLLLYYAIPVRSTQSIWFRLKVVLLLVAGINALLFRAKLKAANGSWDLDRRPPDRIRNGAGVSLLVWSGVVFSGRAIAYDWFDCHRSLSGLLYWAAGCTVELQDGLADQG